MEFWGKEKNKLVKKIAKIALVLLLVSVAGFFGFKEYKNYKNKSSNVLSAQDKIKNSPTSSNTTPTNPNNTQSSTMPIIQNITFPNTNFSSKPICAPGISQSYTAEIQNVTQSYNSNVQYIKQLYEPQIAAILKNGLDPSEYLKAEQEALDKAFNDEQTNLSEINKEMEQYQANCTQQ